MVLDVIPEVEAHNLGQCTPGSAPRRDDGLQRRDLLLCAGPLKTGLGLSSLKMSRILYFMNFYELSLSGICSVINFIEDCISYICEPL
jgi:hypothetical protein